MNQIYRLYITVTNKTFYIGRSIHPEQRLKEHQYNSKQPTNTELKYQAIREFDKNNISWDLEVITEATDEDFEIYKALIDNQPLTNMMAGSIYTEVDKQLIKDKSYFATSEEFQAARLKSVQKTARKRPISKKAYKDTTPVEHMSELGSSKPPTHISPALARIRAKRNK